MNPKKEEEEEEEAEEEENGRRISSRGSEGHVRTLENIYTRYSGAQKAERGSIYRAFTKSGYGDRGGKRGPK